MKRLLFIALSLLAVVRMSAQVEDDDTKYAADIVKAGSAAPDFTIAGLDGKTYTLDSFKGLYFLLDFWATWCPDCRKDVPAMKRLYETYGDRVTFVGVSSDTDREKLEGYVRENGMDWLQVSEFVRRGSRIQQSYGVFWIPSMVLVGPDGRVILGTVMIDKLEAALKKITGTTEHKK